MRNDTYQLVVINTPEELLPFLKHYINQADSYLCSPFYFLLTGRKGLKAIYNGDSSIIFSEHPNLENETIIFPPSTKRELEALDELLTSYRSILKKNLRIIRCSNNHIDLINHDILSKYKLVKQDEYLLDWKFPSLFISVKDVLGMKGKRYKDLRYNLNRVNTSEIKFQKYNHQLHFENSLQLIKKWSKRNTSRLFDESNLSGPYFYLLEQIKIAKHLSSYVMYYKNRFVAFNILDRPFNKEDELTSLAFLADIDFKGIPSFMRYKVCESVNSQGINSIHIGGSETNGLYKFKKKLSPTMELELYSITNY